MPHPYPLTIQDFAAAARVIQRLVEFRDAEDGRGGQTTFINDRSSHLRESLKTLALASEFWAAPSPAAAPHAGPRRRQGRAKSRKR